MGGRRTYIDYAVVSIVVVILVVLLWPSGNDADSHGSTPNELAISTPTADVEPSPEPTETPDPPFVSECLPGDASQVLSDFVQRFSSGDAQQLGEMLPPDGSESATASVYPGMNPHVMHTFAMPGFEIERNRDAVLEFLAGRQESEERWRLKEFALTAAYQDLESENPRIDVAYATIQRSAPDLPVHEIEGRAVVNCVDGLILTWDFQTDHPDFAEPILIEDFLDRMGPYGVGQQRSLRMIVSVDHRPDGGGMTEWDLRREEATSYEGRFVENITVLTLDGRREISYIWSGEGWHLNQRGWSVTANMAVPPDVPFEAMVARREPAFTGGILQDHLESIPREGRHVISVDLVSVPDVLYGMIGIIDAPIAAVSYEVEIIDGAVITSRYRITDERGSHILTPEFRWVAMERQQSMDRTLFHLPRAANPGDQQFRVPSELTGVMVRVTADRAPGGLGELFELRLDELSLPAMLMVTPSRGGLDPAARGDDWGPTWIVHHIERDTGGWLSWSDFADAGYPTVALWDDGRFRYEIRVSSHLPSFVSWNLDELLDLVDSISH